jgi:hypothetical protein
MEDTSMMDTSDTSSSSFTDPISTLFGGFIGIILLILVIILVVIIMIGGGVSWVARTVTGGTTKQAFTNPVSKGPVPFIEANECCATFPQI